MNKGGCYMALTMVAPGETRVFREYRGKEETKRHLQNLGLVKGGKVTVVGENHSGIILQIKDTKIAINYGIASLIMVD